MRLVPIAVMLATAAASLSAQIAAPLLGWLPEGEQIRRMNGLPGAATVGAIANAGRLLAHIAVSPSQNYVLASDAGTGEVILVVPGVSATTLNTGANPDQIATSPRGSSAILWFSGAAQFEILSGLPAALAIRQVDASFLNTGLTALAVTDDGQWMAAASSAGVYEWGPDGVPRQLYGGSDAAALAFFTGDSTLAIATSTQLLSVAGSATSVLYQGSFSPAGVAASLDNRELVLADRSGTIYSIDAATQTPSIANCECRPSGVFGLGGAVFRLTSSSIGAVKLFDASAGAILAVPRYRVTTRRIVRQVQATTALPTLTINVTPTPTGFLQQPVMSITSSSAYPSEIDGYITLYFAPITSNAFTNSSGGGTTYGGTTSAPTTYTVGTDQTIQFSTGGTNVNFTIPAGAIKANFSGASNVTFSTGTIAGTITLYAYLSSPASSAVVATQTVTTKPAFPVISNVKLSQTSGGVTVVVTGYSSTDDMISGVFTFNLSSNATITSNYISVPVSFYFQPYYGSTTASATGSEFTLTVPFTVTGNPADLVGVTVTLINSVAASNPMSSQ